MLAGLALMAVVFMPITETPVAATQPMPVSVTNTPLPVQGTISVGNTPSVNVANTPTVNLASGSTVSVTNPVDTNSNPVTLITRDHDNPAKQYIQLQTSCTNLTGACEPSIYTVPTGKILIIEFASVEASLPAGQSVRLILQVLSDPLGSSFVNHYLPWSDPAPTASGIGGNFAMVGQNIRAYASAGNVIRTVAERTDAFTGTASATFSISGYLVDAN